MLDGLEAATGSKIRSEYRRGDQSGRRDLPKSLAVLVAPATFNTVCKLAAGINDTYALGIVAEAIGRGLPVRDPAVRQYRARGTGAVPSCGPFVACRGSIGPLWPGAVAATSTRHGS